MGWTCLPSKGSVCVCGCVCVCVCVCERERERERSLRQRCPLSPLLFAIATQPILVKMNELATHGEIVGLALPSGKQFIAQALADDSFLFLKAALDNIAKAMEVWNVFALASGLHINM